MSSDQSKFASVNASANSNLRRNRLGLALKLLFSLVAICAANAALVITAAAALIIVTQSGPVKGIAAPGSTSSSAFLTRRRR
jgi:hypothetical protein